MAATQFYGIKYPFNDTDGSMTFFDLDNNEEDGVKSRIFHIVFTPKGQRLRQPEFGTNLIKYIFDPNDSTTLDAIKEEIQTAIKKYISNVEFNDISVYEDGDNGKIVSLDYTVKRGNVGVKNNIMVSI